MEPQKLAYFVKNPRTIHDILKPHLPTAETPFVIRKAITVAAIDYENFITDMTVDRGFIEENAPLCRPGANPVECLLVRQAHHFDGVLIVPEEKRFVGEAAYYTE